MLPPLSATAQSTRQRLRASRLFNGAGFDACEQALYTQAESLLQQALAICKQELGATHPHTAVSLNNLAGLYNELGKDKEAEPLYQRALAICEQVLGPIHPDTAHSLNNLAYLYHEQGKDKQAAPLYQRALAISEQMLGPQHPDTQLIRENHDNLKEDMKRRKKSL